MTVYAHLFMVGRRYFFVFNQLRRTGDDVHLGLKKRLKEATGIQSDPVWLAEIETRTGSHVIDREDVKQVYVNAVMEIHLPKELVATP